MSRLHLVPNTRRTLRLAPSWRTLRSGGRRSRVGLRSSWARRIRGQADRGRYLQSWSRGLGRRLAVIGPKMQDALNRHVQAEAYSAYLYLAMSAWCEAKTWKGFARWLRAQHDEELSHAHK